MKRILPLIIIILFLSNCDRKKVPLVKKKTNKKEINFTEEAFNKLIDNINTFKLIPTDTLFEYSKNNQIEYYSISKNKIEIFKNDNFNIDWIKVNTVKIDLENLKTINPRTDGDNEEMFCNSLQKIRLYEINNSEILLMEFISSPCTGLGCSVTDYIIYDLKNNRTNLFGTFRTSNIDFYMFQNDKEISYISSEFKGDYHGETPMSFVSRLYKIDSYGNFRLYKNSDGNEYFYEITTYSNEASNKFEYKWNWL